MVLCFFNFHKNFAKLDLQEMHHLNPQLVAHKLITIGLSPISVAMRL